jgi:hypothetical protein
MPDISATAQTTIRRLRLLRRGVSGLAIGGAWLGAISRLVGDAFGMAYAEPYTSLRRQPQSRPDDDLGGRDPSW